MVMELKTMLEMNASPEAGWQVPVLQCQANKDRGIDAAARSISEHRAYRDASSELRIRRDKIRRRRFMEILLYRFQKFLESVEKNDLHFQRLLEQVVEERANPYRIAKKLFQDESFLEKIRRSTDQAP